MTASFFQVAAGSVLWVECEMHRSAPEEGPATATTNVFALPGGHAPFASHQVRLELCYSLLSCSGCVGFDFHASHRMCGVARQSVRAAKSLGPLWQEGMGVETVTTARAAFVSTTNANVRTAGCALTAVFVGRST